jgi:RNA polymerase subunit RPABC4/transcription elongation factor Spt4
VEEAIADNGAIKIEFFKEKPKPKPTMDLNLSKRTKSTKRKLSKSEYSGDVDVIDNAPDRLCRRIVDTDSLGLGDLHDNAPEYEAQAVASAVPAQYQETGRVEKGGRSDQEFKVVDMEFEYYPFHTVDYKLLPESERPMEINKVKLKCANCGTKVKQGWKVCPVCTSPIDGKEKCYTCGAELEPAWKVCPICGELIPETYNG